MFESLPNFVISIDGDLQSIHFFSIDAKAKTFSHEVEVYKSEAFTEDFFEMLKNVVKLHRGKKSGKAVLLLPDSVFFTDTIVVPSVQKAISASVDLTIETLYKNASELKINTAPLFQDKNTSTYSLVGVRKELLLKTIGALGEGGVSVAGVTFYSNAVVNGAAAVNPKLKNASYLLMDVKEKATGFSLVVGGKTLGFYNIPFGYRILSDSELNFEPDLFDHTATELLVLNAKERAKRKRLTVLDETEEEGEEVDADKKEGKKGSKLPKSLLRPAPTDADGFVYENFRVLAKWAIEVIVGNQELLSGVDLKNVYVNLPEKYSAVFDKLSSENENSKYTFLKLNGAEERVLNNLGLYGGAYVKKFNKINNF